MTVLSIIHAAAPGGARYDSNQTADERSSFKNGIWLCSNCATHIDADEQRYPAELLQEWKAHAEARAHAALGRSQAPVAEPLAGAASLVATKPHLTGSTRTMRLAPAGGAEPVEALAFPFEAIPKLTFDLTNLGRTDVRIAGLYVDVVSFTEGTIEDLWMWMGLARVVRKYRCAIEPQPGRYLCASEELRADEYLAITPGELESFRIDISCKPKPGVYRLAVAIELSIAGQLLTKLLDVRILLGVYNPSTHDGNKRDERRFGPPPSCR